MWILYTILYKRGIFDNVKSFIERLESDDNKLKELVEDNENNNDKNNENKENNDNDETSLLIDKDSINLKYLIAINNIHN